MFRKAFVVGLIVLLGACDAPSRYVTETTRATLRPPAKYADHFKGHRHVVELQLAQVSSACLALHERHFPNTDWRADWPHHGVMRGCSLTTVEPDDWGNLAGSWSEHCYIILAKGFGRALRQHEEAHCGINGWPHDHPHE